MLSHSQKFLKVGVGKFWKLGVRARHLTSNSSTLFPTTVNLSPVFYLQIFKTICKLVSLRQVLFMSRPLHYLLCICSTCVKPCSTIYIVGNSSSIKSLTYPQTSGKHSLHLIQSLIISVNKIWKKFLEVESKSSWRWNRIRLC